MLPVSAWPPGPPGASLSPFGKPRQIALNCYPHGFVIPKGAWIVTTTSNRVVMFRPPVSRVARTRTPGTEMLPGSIMPPPHPPSPSAATRAAPTSTNAAGAAGCPPTFQKHDAVLEAWRAWQRTIGRTPPPLRPTPGRRPPNWFGWRIVDAPSSTLVQGNSAGTVLADGQNVVILGSGCAIITQAYSV